jgi:hypothetical protein
MSMIEDLRLARKGVENCINVAIKAKTPRGGQIRKETHKTTSQQRNIGQD